MSSQGISNEKKKQAPPPRPPARPAHAKTKTASLEDAKESAPLKPAPPKKHSSILIGDAPEDEPIAADQLQLLNEAQRMEHQQNPYDDFGPATPAEVNFRKGPSKGNVGKGPSKVNFRKMLSRKKEPPLQEFTARD